jgi:hypothetical protein
VLRRSYHIGVGANQALLKFVAKQNPPQMSSVKNTLTSYVLGFADESSSALEALGAAVRQPLLLDCVNHKLLNRKVMEIERLYPSCVAGVCRYAFGDGEMAVIKVKPDVKVFVNILHGTVRLEVLAPREVV